VVVVLIILVAIFLQLLAVSRISSMLATVPSTVVIITLFNLLPTNVVVVGLQLVVVLDIIPVAAV
jgi:hypothetical protein